MDNKGNKMCIKSCTKVLLILLIILVIFIFMYTELHLYKTNIHKASKEEIRQALYMEEYNGLTDNIIIFLSENKDCKIADLKRIDGIGDEKIKELKLVFRDNITIKHLYEYE